MIRPATIYDVPRIQQVINSHAEFGKMLFKSLAQLYEGIRDFAVYEVEDGTCESPAGPRANRARRRGGGSSAASR